MLFAARHNSVSWVATFSLFRSIQNVITAARLTNRFVHRPLSEEEQLRAALERSTTEEKLRREALAEEEAQLERALELSLFEVGSILSTRKTCLLTHSPVVNNEC